jgi:hypothetical protein
LIRNSIWALLLVVIPTVMAQDRTDSGEILKRLARLEEQNRQIMEEIKALREQLSTPASTPETETAAAPLEERVAVQERRTADLDESKVGTEHRLPVQLTGTVLFNAFSNGQYGGNQLNPVVAAPVAGQSNAGGTLRQSIIGFRFDGPEVVGGAKTSGTLLLDLFGGSGAALNQLVRLRVATLDIAWKNTTLTFGQDKPIIAPRDPDSLAQVGISPLTAAGNLWLWAPQFRVEQRFALGEHSGVRAQVGVYQTDEGGDAVPSEYASTLSPARPGLEGRFNWWGEHGSTRFEIAPGFHASDSHVAGVTVPSRIFSVDWLIRPVQSVDFTGQFFDGENVAVIGGLRQGISFYRYEGLHATHASGGWAQLAVRPTPRITFHFYGGQEDDRNSDLIGNAIGKNQAYAGNIMYRLGSNLLTSFEISHVRTTYLKSGTTSNTHYDLALAYLF